MLLNKEIPSSIVPEISNMVKYLKTNYIFKYERRKFLEECSPEISKVLAIARQRFWYQKTSEETCLMKNIFVQKTNHKESEN
jgi:hypothetical protein